MQQSLNHYGEGTVGVLTGIGVFGDDRAALLCLKDGGRTRELGTFGKVQASSSARLVSTIMRD